MNHSINNQLTSSYTKKTLILYASISAFAAILIAGFWNYHLVDGFGQNFIAGNTIGDTSELAGGFEQYGSGFGFIFAAIAGLAATFTACNCVVFAMLPGLACSADQSKVNNPWMALGAFVGGVTIVSIIYGIYIGLIGPTGVEAMNVQEVRLSQAQTVFTVLGIIMLIWGFLEMGFLDRIKNLFSNSTQSFMGTAITKGTVIGILVGLFAVGRPFPVFREFLIYAAQAESPLYGAGVMMAQGLGQILIMILLFAIMVWIGGKKLMVWATESPHKPKLLSGLALITGGVFFIFYWGLAFAFDIGQWGFKLGLY
ncbi:MAG: sulfite exporter TauE/SafE family protein [Balneolaceae bacterium]